MLFYQYIGMIRSRLPEDAMLTSYADDPYVVLHDRDQEVLISRTENCLTTHIANLEAIGMKVNKNKMKIILFGKDEPKILANVKGIAVESKPCIKALGVQIDKALS